MTYCDKLAWIGALEIERRFPHSHLRVFAEDQEFTQASETVFLLGNMGVALQRTLDFEENSIRNRIVLEVPDRIVGEVRLLRIFWQLETVEALK